MLGRIATACWIGLARHRGVAGRRRSLVVLARRRARPSHYRSPTFVGGANCTSCHAKETASLARIAPRSRDAGSLRADGAGRFRRRAFTQAGVTSTFFRRDGRFFVNTDGPDGKLADFEIRYTFGVAAAAAIPDRVPGRSLAGARRGLGCATEGRGRPALVSSLPRTRNCAAGDRLHWTGIDQNWNYQCAGCHSTNLRKNYDSATNRFKTTWTDIDVNCESCHGPGSNHVAWAKKDEGWQRFGGDGKGLPVVLDERHGVHGPIDPSTRQRRA